MLKSFGTGFSIKQCNIKEYISAKNFHSFSFFDTTPCMHIEFFLYIYMQCEITQTGNDHKDPHRLAHILSHCSKFN